MKEWLENKKRITFYVLFGVIISICFYVIWTYVQPIDGLPGKEKIWQVDAN